MTPNWQIDWHDGLLLTAAHLTEQAHLISAPCINALKLLNPYYWGLSLFEIEKDKLDSGIFSISKINGIFKNGQYFNYNSNNDAPLIIDIGECDRPYSIYLYYDQNNIEHQDGEVKKYKSILKLTTSIDTHPLTLKLYEHINSFVPSFLNSKQLKRHINPLIDITSQHPQLLYINKCLSAFDYDYYHPYQLHQLLFNICLKIEYHQNITTYDHNCLYSSIIILSQNITQYIKSLYDYHCCYFIKVEFYWSLQKPLIKENIRDLIIAIPRCEDHSHLSESLVKVTDLTHIESLSKYGTQGLPLTQIFMLPTTITMESHYQYYRLSVSSTDFQNMSNDIHLCLHILQQQLMDTPKCWVKY